MAATVTIRYDVDPSTGKRTIIVSYQSDPDALPMEHEEEHRAIVEKLIEGGVIAARDAGRVRVEREGSATGREPASSPRAGASRRTVEERG